jgi:hypothetical protein
VSPVKYELGFISQKTTFFIVTAVKTSNLTYVFTPIFEYNVQQHIFTAFVRAMIVFELSAPRIAAGEHSQRQPMETSCRLRTYFDDWTVYSAYVARQGRHVGWSQLGTLSLVTGLQSRRSVVSTTCVLF